jgi:hypothetical protein
MMAGGVDWPGGGFHDGGLSVGDYRTEKTAEKKSISDPFDLDFSKQPA